MKKLIVLLAMLASVAGVCPLAGAQTTNGSLTITGSPLTLTVPANFSGGFAGSAKQNVPFSGQLLASNGAGSGYTFSKVSGNFPAGINDVTNTGLVAGTPTGTSAGTEVVKLTDASGTAVQVSITMTPAGLTGTGPCSAAICVTLPGTSVQTTQTLGPVVATGYWSDGTATDISLLASWSCSSGAACSGSSLSVIDGTEAFTAGSATGSATAQASLDSVNGTATITVGTTTPTWITTSLPKGQINQPYSEAAVGQAQLFCSGGTSPYTFAVHTGFTLPSGLSLTTSGQSGDTHSVISGTPSGSGTTAVEFDCTDSASHTNTSASMNIVIASVSTVGVTPASPSISNGSQQQFTANLTYSDSSTGTTTNLGTPGQIAYVQGNSKTQSSSATSISQSFTTNTTAGNFIIATAGAAGSSISSMTDGTNTYTCTTNGSSGICYAANIAGGAVTVTANFAGSSSFSLIYIHEYSGIATTTPQDQSAVGTGSGTAVASPSVTTTSANELIFGYAGVANRVSAPGSGFTSRQTAGGDMSEDETVSATGTYAATFTQNVSGTWTAFVKTFKAAGGTSNGWTSSNTGVATINGNGLAQGLATGTSTIQGTYLGVSGSTTLTVAGISDTSLTVCLTGSNPCQSNVSALVGANVTFTAKGNNTGNDFTAQAAWGSGGSGVATLVSGSTFNCATAGTATITATTASLSGSATVTCSNSSAKVYYNNNFESGSLSPCSAYNVNGGASVSVVTTQNHTPGGSHSAYMNSNANAVLCSMNAPGAKDPQRASADPNGLYWGFWFYTDATTVNAVLTCNGVTNGCGAGTGNGNFSQWKISTTRTNLTLGGPSICPGSLTTNGIPYASGEPGFNTAGDYGWWDVCGGLFIHPAASGSGLSGSAPITGNTWHHVQFYSIYNDTANTINPVNGYAGNAPLSVPAGQGILLIYFDGAQIGNLTASYFGAPCTSTSTDSVTGQPCQGPFYPNEVLQIAMGLFDLINPDPSNAAIQVWIDDVCAADGPVC